VLPDDVSLQERLSSLCYTRAMAKSEVSRSSTAFPTIPKDFQRQMCQWLVSGCVNVPILTVLSSRCPMSHLSLSCTQMSQCANVPDAGDSLSRQRTSMLNVLWHCSWRIAQPASQAFIPSLLMSCSSFSVSSSSASLDSSFVVIHAHPS